MSSTGTVKRIVSETYMEELNIFTSVVIVTVLLTQPAVTSSDTQNFTLGVFIPRTGALTLGPETETAVRWTVERLNARFSSRFHFEYTIKNTECNKDAALTKFVEMLCERSRLLSHIHAIIGPTCDEVCQVVGGLAGNRGIPVISNGCGSSSMADRDIYPTFLRTSGAYIEVERFLEEVARAFRWNRLTVVHGDGAVWLNTADEFADTLKHSGFHVRQLSIRNSETLQEDVWNESTFTRVFLICAYGEDIVRFMNMAAALGLTDGKYAFLTIDFANNAKIVSNWTHNRALDGLLDITLDVSPHSAVYRNFTSQVFADARSPLAPTCASNYERGIHAALLSDAITLYAAAVNATITNNGDPTNITDIANHLYGVTFEGVSGRVEIDSTGNRLAHFMLHNIQEGCYVSIATFDDTSQLTFLNASVVWPGGSLDIPADSPPCGWTGELCPNDDTTTFIIVGSTSAVVIAALFGAVLAMCKYIKRRENALKLKSTDWKISFADLKKPRRSICVNEDSFYSEEAPLGSSVSMESTDSLRSTVERTEGLYYYKGQVVVAKSVVKPFGLVLTAALSMELNKIRHLEHWNVNPFIGACIDKGHLCVISTYCRKGSLFDLLHKSDLKFDRRFLASFSTDISKGLQYIHHSELGYHGRLKSRNVFVDGTFTCKIGDFPTSLFKDGETASRLSETYRTRHLWSAPEVVTGEIYRQGQGDRTWLWQKADIWSFGVILHEIVNRKKPFPALYDTDPEAAEEELRQARRPDGGSVELLQDIRHRRSQCTSSGDHFVLHVLDLMTQCWHAFPELRVSSANAAKILRDSAKEHQLLSSNLYENLLHMLSKNEEELARQVALRTMELESEKDRTNELLYQMLPRVVAEQLIRGERPRAEHFDCVTIFFSDIVQFTDISKQCTPLEVMEMVNELYLAFDRVIENYNVYKVETIGDAYMVVSGLPERNGDRHAGAIAGMALHLLSQVGRISVPYDPKETLRIRVGIHSGPVVAGVVGSKMPRYCLFGDTVNTASRMESHGEPLKIQISEDTKKLLDKSGGFSISRRSDTVHVKGKGEMPTFWLNGRDGRRKERPTSSRVSVDDVASADNDVMTVEDDKTSPNDEKAGRKKEHSSLPNEGKTSPYGRETSSIDTNASHTRRKTPRTNDENALLTERNTSLALNSVSPSEHVNTCAQRGVGGKSKRANGHAQKQDIVLGNMKTCKTNREKVAVEEE